MHDAAMPCQDDSSIIHCIHGVAHLITHIDSSAERISHLVDQHRGQDLLLEIHLHRPSTVPPRFANSKGGR